MADAPDQFEGVETAKRRTTTPPSSKFDDGADADGGFGNRSRESEQASSKAEQRDLSFYLTLARSPSAQAILKLAPQYADRRREGGSVIDVNSILCAALVYATEYQGSSTQWLIEWMQKGPATRDVVGWIRERAGSGAPGAPSLGVDAREVLERAVSLAKSTVARDQFDTRHLLAACLTARESIAGAVSRFWMEGIGVDVLEFRPRLLERIIANPEPSENLEAWRNILGPRPPLGSGATDSFPEFESDRADGKADALKTHDDVEAFAQLFCLQGVKLPLSVALFGAWGSGKTSFMERLLDRVDKITGDEKAERAAEKAAKKKKREEAQQNAASAAGGTEAVALPARTKEEIENELAAEEAEYERTRLYAANVVQIRFNAWHYADANLWASLTAEFFDQLRAGGAGLIGKATYDGLVSRVARHVRDLESETALKVSEATDLDFKLRKAKDEERRSQDALDQVAAKTTAEQAREILSVEFDKHKAELKEIGRRAYLDDLGSDIDTFSRAIQDAASLPGKLRSIWRVVRRDPKSHAFAIAAIVLILVAAGLGAWLLSNPTQAAVWYMQLSGSGVAAIAAAVTAALRAIRLLKPIFDRAAAFSTELAKKKSEAETDLNAKKVEVVKLEQKAAEAARQAASKKKQLELFTGTDVVRAPETLLRFLLADESETKRYEDELGVVSRARRSFEKLDEIIRRRRDGTLAVRALGSDVPDRIVLYIDDLDRCSHDKVYDVLQAVHLLLALESFVVVVGVDVRWIEGAIASHLEASGNKDAGVQPLEYLEKIFQIPFWLRPLSTARGGTYSGFIDHLLKENLPPPPNFVPGAAAAVPSGQTGGGQQGNDQTDKSLPGAPAVTSAAPAATAVSGMAANANPPAERAAAVRSRLVLTTPEYELMRSPEIGMIVGKSPRAVKRFVNTYRILRQRNERLARFLGADGEPPLYPIAILLLAIEVGQPTEFAQSVREYLAGGGDDALKAIGGMLTGLRSPDGTSLPDDTRIQRLEAAIERIVSLDVERLPMSEWHGLLQDIRRYSFNPLIEDAAKKPVLRKPKPAQ